MTVIAKKIYNTNKAILALINEGTSTLQTFYREDAPRLRGRPEEVQLKATPKTGQKPAVWHRYMPLKRQARARIGGKRACKQGGTARHKVLVPEGMGAFFYR
ncbi:hypothetical protein BRE01_46590 [Brevibacillus reuszeri]|uniref:Uncharacterized protein n=1 Tax=Brevibacillus reuszeri TaxID=54915 RepID=A0ABQ0TSN6_9BACL|nr:hypothetical protein BRE01_46590 [Brevibacillus reuszeri]